MLSVIKVVKDENVLILSKKNVIFILLKNINTFPFSHYLGFIRELAFKVMNFPVDLQIFMHVVVKSLLKFFLK